MAGKKVATVDSNNPMRQLASLMERQAEEHRRDMERALRIFAQVDQLAPLSEDAAEILAKIEDTLNLQRRICISGLKEEDEAAVKANLLELRYLLNEIAK